MDENYENNSLINSYSNRYTFNFENINTQASPQNIAQSLPNNFNSNSNSNSNPYVINTNAIRNNQWISNSPSTYQPINYVTQQHNQQIQLQPVYQQAQTFWSPYNQQWNTDDRAKFNIICNSATSTKETNQSKTEPFLDFLQDLPTPTKQKKSNNSSKPSSTSKKKNSNNGKNKKPKSNKKVKKPKPENPTINIRKLNKKLRSEGKSYVSVRKIKQSDKICKIKVERPGRQLRERCTSKFCQRTTRRRCYEISDEKREALFQKFWNKMTWEDRKIFVINNVRISLPKERKPKNEIQRLALKHEKLKRKQQRRQARLKAKQKNTQENEQNDKNITENQKESDNNMAENQDDQEESIPRYSSRRNFTMYYYLPVCGEKYQVCGKMFSNTLGITHSNILRWVKTSSDGMSDKKMIRPEDLCQIVLSDDNKKKKSKKEKVVKTVETQENKDKKEEDFIEYISIQDQENEDLIIEMEIENLDKQMGEACTSIFCKRSRRRRCEDISNFKRKLIFQEFWNEMSAKERRKYLTENIRIMPPKARTTQEYLLQKRQLKKLKKEQKNQTEHENKANNEISIIDQPINLRRNVTVLYYLRISGETYPVCKKMFASTLAVNQTTIHKYIKRLTKSSKCRSRSKKKIKKRKLKNSRAYAKSETSSEDLIEDLYDMGEWDDNENDFKPNDIEQDLEKENVTLNDCEEKEIKNTEKEELPEPITEYVCINDEENTDLAFEMENEYLDKQMGERCASKFCERSKRHRCNDISDFYRKMLFQEFWNEMSASQRQKYLRNNIKLMPPKQRTTPEALEKLRQLRRGKEPNRESEEEDSCHLRRIITAHYTLTICNEVYPVCKKMFENTLGVERKTVTNCIKKLPKPAVQDLNKMVVRKFRSKYNKTNKLQNIKVEKQEEMKIQSDDSEVKIILKEEEQQQEDTTKQIGQTVANPITKLRKPTKPEPVFYGPMTEEEAMIKEHIQNRYNYQFLNHKYKKGKINIREVSKKLRAKGKAYVGITKIVAEDSSVLKMKLERPARRLGETCTSAYCQRSKKRRCQEIPEETRERIFTKFWNDLSWEQRQIYVVNNITLMTPIKRYTGIKTESKRKLSKNYFLPVKTERFPVCKYMFLSTLGLGEHAIDSWITKHIDVNEDLKRNRDNNKKCLNNRERRQMVHDFLDSLPKLNLPPEMIEKSSEKMKTYFEQDIKNMSELYGYYKKYVEERTVGYNCKPFSQAVFSDEFKETNYEFRRRLKYHKLYKDFFGNNENDNIQKDNVESEIDQETNECDIKIDLKDEIDDTNYENNDENSLFKSIDRIKTDDDDDDDSDDPLKVADDADSNNQFF